ncbi:MAG TPA: DUF1775 domain-containing protein [Beijerinckiaceae bacterium]|nr:DUF1775 domain-containing protein [Beijerinckiaceae bacterium]
MFTTIGRMAAISVAALCLTATAHAHATFDIAEATQDSSFKGVVKIGHGCEGSPTHTVIISVPEGVIGVKPMPKSGWKLKTTTGAYARTYDYFGRPMSEGVKEIVWSDGQLKDSEYDEFVFSSRISGAVPTGPLHFPVTQLCEKGEHRWSEVAAPGVDPHSLKSPAPAVRIKAKQVAQAGGHGSHGTQTQAQHQHHAAPTASGLILHLPWTRATPPGAKVAGGFMTIENKTGTADRLIGGSFEVANVFEVHEMAMEGGVMKMRALPKGLEVPAGGKAELKPGGYHVMFIDLKRQLKEGEKLKGELVFEKAGKIPVEYIVRPIGSTSGGHAH